MIHGLIYAAIIWLFVGQIVFEFVWREAKAVNNVTFNYFSKKHFNVLFTWPFKLVSSIFDVAHKSLFNKDK